MANLAIKQLRDAGEALGRALIAELALGFISECDGSYKSTMELCGKLSVIAKMATYDDYWHEQVNRGINRAEIKVESLALMKEKAA